MNRSRPTNDTRATVPALTRIFVYGTLRAGEPNHRLLEGHVAARHGRTPALFDLVSLGPFPAMVTGGRTSVVGEVYDVDPDTLAAVDRLEGHPHFYERTPIRLDDGELVMAYLLPTKQAHGRPRIPSGDWMDAKPNWGEEDRRR